MSQFLLGWCPGICIWTNFQGIRGNTYVWDSLISWKWSLERVSCQSTELPSTSDYFKLNSNSNNYKSDTILGSGAMHACLVTQSCLTLQPHWLQHAKLFCPSPSPGACSSSYPLSRLKPSSNLILCRPLLLLPSIFLSFRVFSNESVLPIMWPKYWSFSFSISFSNEYSGLISFRIDSFDLLAVQRILKSLLQHHSSKVSILRHLEFFMIQPTLISIHDYWKNHGFD